MDSPSGRIDSCVDTPGFPSPFQGKSGMSVLALEADIGYLHRRSMHREGIRFPIDTCLGGLWRSSRPSILLFLVRPAYCLYQCQDIGLATPMFSCISHRSRDGTSHAR